MRTFLASSLVVMACIMTLTQCRWLEVDPDQYILAEDALKTPEDLQALLVSCYDVLANLYDGDVQLINELRLLSLVLLLRFNANWSPLLGDAGC